MVDTDQYMGPLKNEINSYRHLWQKDFYLGAIHKRGGREVGQKCPNLLSKKTTKGEGEGWGVIKSEKWADVVYGWPPSMRPSMQR